jgi:signal transduction histidine kinase/ActR/RegA family two-component response regulator
LIGKTIELEGRRKDGSEFPIELSLTAWTTEEGQFYTGIARDITLRKQKEQAELESQVLADMNRRKDEFLAMLSHELRNPLAPISTAVELLRREDSSEAIRRQAMAILGRQVSHLTRLVDDLLEVSRISTGRIRLQEERIEIRPVVERAVDAVRPLIHECQHEFTQSLADEAIWVNADAARLEQVIVNLLTNAAKYTNAGGEIRLTLQREGDEAVLRIADSGVGIEPELLPAVFDLFTQAERSLDRSQGGLGVGLTIVQRVVELHGGKVTAYSAGLGEGSEFVVRLPLAEKVNGVPRMPVKSIAQNARGQRVLVVDDNKDAADSIAMLLRQAGHDALVAYSSALAIETAKKFQPNAVFLDIGLPEMNGYEVASRLRNMPALKDTLLIALTGYGREADQHSSQEAGFDAHLVKPVDPQRIQEALAALMDRRPKC